MKIPLQRPASALVFVAVALAASSSQAQSAAAPTADPKRCVVVVEDFGDVGFRIGDAQMLADGILSVLRKRVGVDGATYQGMATSAQAMKKLLGNSIEGAPSQDAQIAYWKACSDNAPWRIRARFGSSGKKQWATVQCRKTKDGDKAPPVEEKRFEAARFMDVRDQVVAMMPTFCGGIDGRQAPAVDNSARPEGFRKKEAPTEKWAPPPKR